MSLSRAELEAMDRDELIESIMELQGRVADLEAQPSLDGEEIAGVRRLLNGLSQTEGDELVNQSAPDKAADGVDRIDDLDDRVAEIEGAVKPHTGNEAYEEMDRDDRVFEVRVNLAMKAAESNGNAAYTYDNVTSTFNEKPSDGYAYKLMKQAAGYDGDREVSEKDGFEYTNNPEGQRQLRCNVAAVNDDAVLHAVNNRLDSGGA